MSEKMSEKVKFQKIGTKMTENFMILKYHIKVPNLMAWDFWLFRAWLLIPRQRSFMSRPIYFDKILILLYNIINIKIYRTLKLYILIKWFRFMEFGNLTAINQTRESCHDIWASVKFDFLSILSTLISTKYPFYPHFPPSAHSGAINQYFFTKIYVINIYVF